MIITKRRHQPRRGKTSADDINDLQDEIIADLNMLDSQIRVMRNNISVIQRTKLTDIQGLRDRVEELRDEVAFLKDVRASNNDTEHFVESFRSFENIRFDGISLDRRLRIEPKYGQCVTPANRVVSRFFSTNITTGEVFPATGLNPVVTPIMETNARRVVPGNPENAFNGNNENFWIRKVVYPLESDVEEVEVEIVVDVPTSFSSFSNALLIDPYPMGTVDISSILYSTSSATPSITLPGFSAVKSAGPQKFHFTDTAISKLAIRLKQKDWVIEGGEKVFYYGAEKISLQLIEYDKVYDSANKLTNNSAIVQVDAPSGRKFGSIINFISTPTWAVLSSDPPIQYRIATDLGFSSVVWNSFTDPKPSDSNIDISTSSASTIYILVNLGFDSSSGKTPVLDRFGLEYTTEAI